MSGLFNMDNPVWRALGRLADLMILNILFLICCIPIFTIGASLTALNYVALKMHDGEEGYVTRSFFRSFRQNFKQATGMWLIELALGAILVLDLMILRSCEGTFYTVVTVIIYIICIAYLIVFLYLFAILSRFDNTIRNTFKNAFIMAIADFPRTVAMLAIAAAAVVLTFFNGTTLTWALLVWILAGFALIAYCNTWFLNTTFKKYVPSEEDTTDPDHWDVDQTMGISEEEKSIEIAETIENTETIENAESVEDTKDR